MMIVTYAFGAQSIERHVLQSLLCSLFPPIFNANQRNICARLVGDLASFKPLTLDKSPACLKEPRCVFAPRWFKSAVDLAIDEQVSQAVESRNAFSSKTNHRSWTYGSFAKLRRVSSFEIRPAFQTLIIILERPGHHPSLAKFLRYPIIIFYTYIT